MAYRFFIREKILMPLLTDSLSQSLGHWLVQQAQADGLAPVCIALSNPDGALQYFLRMDAAPVRTISIAQAKAYSAARFGSSTLALQERLQRESLSLSDFMDPALCALPGGVPLEINATQIGAVGISGRSLADDHALAMLANEFLQQYAR
ncbi:heme-binding protein [Paenalcaligenes hominis]|uniref:GlcG/HbpS family heme-binding protein n=1 Tax=Paenalcaligenes hominis TaxID=643674 RepID=UPI00352375A8